jgi:hypothetical protein
MYCANDEPAQEAHIFAKSGQLNLKFCYRVVN